MTASTTDRTRKRVRDLMSAPVLTTTPRTEATDAALLIGLRGITTLPVLDDGRLVGMFTEAALLRCQRASGRSNMLVQDVMDPVALVATPDCDPAELDEAMHSRHIRSVPVLEDVRLVGIITSKDLRGRTSPAGPLA
jgi:CBS domain-containing protein